MSNSGDAALMTAHAFIKKWKRVDLTERQTAHEHFLDLCNRRRGDEQDHAGRHFRPAGADRARHSVDPERAEAAIKLVLSEKKVTEYELTARARDGKQTVVSYNATTFYDRGDMSSYLDRVEVISR